MALSTSQKLIVGSGAAIVGLAVFLAVKKASAAPKKAPPLPVDPSPGVEKAPPIFAAAPVPKEEPGVPAVDPGKPFSSKETTPDVDPISAAGWNWDYLGVVDPAEANTVVGVEITEGQLPVTKADITYITPIGDIVTIYYVGPGDMMGQGYYVIGPLKSEGYAFEPGAWGIVEIWDPSW